MWRVHAAAERMGPYGSDMRGGIHGAVVVARAGSATGNAMAPSAALGSNPSQTPSFRRASG
jgi:hypothetical protein